MPPRDDGWKMASEVGGGRGIKESSRKERGRFLLLSFPSVCKFPFCIPTNSLSRKQSSSFTSTHHSTTHSRLACLPHTHHNQSYSLIHITLHFFPTNNQQPSTYKMATYHQQPTYYHTTTLPIAVPHKQPYYSAPSPIAYAVSPPEAPESVSTGTATYGYSVNSPSYAGSASGGDYDSSASANGVDMQEYMQDRFGSAFDPLPLDRTLAVQAQT